MMMMRSSSTPSKKRSTMMVTRNVSSSSTTTTYSTSTGHQHTHHHHYHHNMPSPNHSNANCCCSNKQQRDSTARSSFSRCCFKSTKRSFGIVFVTLVLVSVKTFQKVVDHHVIESLLSKSSLGLGLDGTPNASTTAASLAYHNNFSLKGSVAVQDQRRADLLLPPSSPTTETAMVETESPAQSSSTNEQKGHVTSDNAIETKAPLVATTTTATTVASSSPSLNAKSLNRNDESVVAVTAASNRAALVVAAPPPKQQPLLEATAATTSSSSDSSNNSGGADKEPIAKVAAKEAPKGDTKEEDEDQSQSDPNDDNLHNESNSNSQSFSVLDFVAQPTAPGSITTFLTDATQKHVYWKGRGPLDLFAKHYFQRTNRYCLSIDEALTGLTGQAATVAAATSEEASSSSSPLPVDVHMHIEFECKELFYNSGYGTGNIITMLYGMRLSSLVRGHVSLNFTCTDAETTKPDLILPWLTGSMTPRRRDILDNNTPNPYPDLTSTDVCGAYFTTKIVHMYRDMQYDLRRMAIGLVGVPNNNHPAARWMAETYGKTSSADRQEWSPQVPLKFKDNDERTVDPVFALSSDSNGSADRLSSSQPPTIQLDDAVIHFRCGDLMDSTHGEFAFLPFASYVHDISPDARSIGIITQPFPKDKSVKATDINHYAQQARFSDASPKTQNRCQTVVLAMVDYIQERHPLARVRIHNGPSETIALAYARMIMANQTIVGISTFGVFPVLSTFGTGYLHQPQGPFVNGWMFSPVRIDELASNVHWIEDTKYIMVADMKRLWETEGEAGVVAWFRGGDGPISAASGDDQDSDQQGDSSQTDATASSEDTDDQQHDRDQPSSDATASTEAR